ncbi:MAG: ABC transporter ATP-binding protein [Thermoleophilia bacterium]|nr:ABC transporter ATP-binding protein [Thermoleophilia bacterium]
MLLEIKDLVANYGKAQALKGISLEVGEGEVVALIGANGAGKTTLLRSISALKRIESGEIIFGGERVDQLPGHELVRKGIAHVPEGRIVFGPMTVTDNLRMGAYLRKDKAEVRRDIESMYEHFPVLKERGKQLAESLSGGEQQMLAVARALMAKPKLLLMDEPSMGLSPLMVEMVGKIIVDIRKRGLSVLLVEQNATMALALSDRAYVLEVGSIVLEGPAADVARNDVVRKAYLGV